jgi:YD repeat-containing protein
MYGRRRCEPVIAGLLVRNDIGHLTRVFARRRHTTSGRCNGHDRLVAAAASPGAGDLAAAVVPDRPAQEAG